jgi:hypothetical protein
MKKNSSILLVCCLFLFHLPMGQASQDAFIGASKKNLKKDFDSVALMPVDAPDVVKMPDEVAQLIESEVVKILEKEGFEVLGPQAMRDIRENMEQLLKVSDTDQNLDEKRAAILEHSYREFLFRHKVKAIVALRVHVVAAPFANDKAEWDGTSQKIKHSGDGLMKLIGGQSYTGSIGASSLKVTFWDRAERLLYSSSGGIEVLMQRNAKALETLPDDQFWKDEMRIRKAVKIALQPL